MESIDKPYLAFAADELYYLLDLSEVERIQDGKPEDGAVYLDFSIAVGGSACADKEIYKYTILLKTEEDEKETAILAEQIAGIIEIGNLKKFPLKSPLINSRNEYLNSIVRVPLETGEKWAYLLQNSSLLKAEYAQKNIEQSVVSRNIDQRTENKEEYLGNQCIELLQGEKSWYIDKNRVEAVVIKPVIQRVPKAPEYVLGISFYKDNMVVYYEQFYAGSKVYQGTDSVIPPKNLMEYTCGIIFKTSDGILAGIAGEAIGEVKLHLEERESLITLGNGIWERKCD